MESKSKFIIIGLIGVVVICFFLFLQASASKQQVIRERDQLKRDNDGLTAKITQLSSEINSNKDKIGSLNLEVDRAVREKEELQKRYELLRKANDELVEKLKSQKAPVASAPSGQSLAESAPAAQEAYWAGILKTKTDLEFQLDSVRKELKAMQINSEQLQREKGSLELDINNLKREKEDINRQFSYNQRIMDSISQELVREKNDKMKIEESLKALKNENVILARQLRLLNNRKVELEKKAQELREDNAALGRRFNDMETMLAGKISQINLLKDELNSVLVSANKEGREPSAVSGAKESVELPPIVIRPPQEERTQAAVSTAGPKCGKILAVNKDENFIIIDLGDEAGVKVGDVFQVYRQEQNIGSIEVIKTRGSVAACDIKKETTPLKIGDSVK